MHKLQRLQIRSSPSAIIDPFRIVSLGAAFAFGFFLQFNIMTSTLGLPFMRITDGLMFLFVPCLFVVVGMSKVVRDGLFYFVVLFAIVGTSLLFKTAVERGDTYLTLIFLLTSVFAFFFVEIAEDEAFIVYFAAGTVLGLIPSVAVLFAQASGNAGLAEIGLGVPTNDKSSLAVLFAKTKWGGLWDHGNEAGHVYGVATASALYLALKFRKPTIYLAVYALLVATFSVTLNRAGLIAPTMALLYCYIRMGHVFLFLKTAVIVVVSIVALASLSNAPGLDVLNSTIEARFVEDSHAETNVAERLMSNIEGAKVALENPFGIGFQERISIMIQRTTDGIISIHNGFLSLAYQSGLFVSLFYVLSCTYLFVHRRSVSPFYVMMFMFTATSMFFEELSINQFFIFSVALTTAAAWLHYAKRRNVVVKKPLPILQDRSSFEKLPRCGGGSNRSIARRR